MNCIDCHEPLPEDIGFCPACGAPTGKAAQGSQRVPVTHHPPPPGWYGDIAPKSPPRPSVKAELPSPLSDGVNSHHSGYAIESNAASLEQRLKAWLIDMACYLALYVGLCAVLIGLSLLFFPGEMMALAAALWSVVLLLLSPFVMARLECSTGSPGKRLMGLKVVCKDSGRSLPYGRASGREILRLLWNFAFPIAHLIQYLMAANEPSHRVAHDHLMNCRVINARATNHEDA